MVAAFPLDISVLLSSLYVPEVYPHCWSFLEGYLSHPGLARLIFVRSEEGNLLGLQPSTLSLRDYLFWGSFSHLLILERIHISK